jgi:2'-5' RNA ligase
MTHRLFTGFPIDPQPTLLECTHYLQRELAEERIRWVQPLNLHVTLWFFGDVSKKDIPSIIQRLQLASCGLPSFTVKVKGSGCFGSSKNPSVLWLGLEKSGTLTQLYLQIVSHLQLPGTHTDEKEYKPHLTLGRAKRINDPSRLKEIIQSIKDKEFQVASIDKYYLYESILRPDGPVYKKIHEFKLSDNIDI